jgi:hypothetical protein
LPSFLEVMLHSSFTALFVCQKGHLLFTITISIILFVHEQPLYLLLIQALGTEVLISQLFILPFAHSSSQISLE